MNKADDEIGWGAHVVKGATITLILMGVFIVIMREGARGIFSGNRSSVGRICGSGERIWELGVVGESSLGVGVREFRGEK